MMTCVLRAVLLVLAAFSIMAADKPCPISEATIKGTWTQAGEAGYFEEVDFSSDGRRRIFNSWLHQRPDISGGIWSLDNCVLHVTHPTDANLSFSFIVKPGRRHEIVLFDTETKVSTRYRRVK